MKILLGISGGVDSAYAAKKLLDEGNRVEGAILLMHEYSELEEAKRVSDSIGIPLHIIDATSDFDEIVKKDLCEEYLKGRTPNPCIICNERVKLKKIYDFAKANGFDRIATGHYADIVKVDSFGEHRYAIKRPSDGKKDQSYMLYRLPQEILSSIIFPLSGMHKDSVRQMAAETAIPVANRRDSQEICFLPDGNHAEYIESLYGKSAPGDFVDESGRIIGKHNGIIRYTVGQRKGLGISLGERAFITKIDPFNNIITVSTEYRGYKRVLLRDTVGQLLTPKTGEIYTDLTVKLRYSAPDVPTKATILPDGAVMLEFDSPTKASLGQSAVLYKNDTVAFGGIISEVED